VKLGLSQLDIWGRQEQLIGRLLTAALSDLARSRPASEIEEDDLNRRLSHALDETRFEMARRGEEVPIALHHYEARNHPSLHHPRRHPREHKRPDFVWSFEDDTARSACDARRVYTVECKRLGKRLRSGRVLASLYIEEGVRRFLVDSHGYAFNERSGAMVGYIQNSDHLTLLKDVNAAAAAEHIALLSEEGPVWPTGRVCHLRQVHLVREGPTPFVLSHHWVDVRRAGRARRRMGGDASAHPDALTTRLPSGHDRESAREQSRRISVPPRSLARRELPEATATD
jgi:hypothetical protein